MYYGEKLNSITHLVGAVFALIGFGCLLTLGVQSDSLALKISFFIFGLTLVLLYCASTLYHSFHHPRLKNLFQKLDHVAIYLLIAGTYTPYLLVSLIDHGGVGMFIWIWSIALVGITLDVAMRERNETLQVSIYFIMGWTCLFKVEEMEASLPSTGLIWLIVGGLAYTFGVIFYALDHLGKLNHAHGIWHLFVLLGSACHFVSIVGYVR